MTKTKKKKRAKKPGKAEDVLERLLENREARIEITTRSFAWFFLFYFREHLTVEAAPFHKELFRLAEDESISLAVIVAFRGSGKSTILNTAYAIWSALGVQQKKFIILSGQTEENARQGLLNIKSELETNDLLRHDLGPFDEERNQWGSTALVIRRLNAKIMIRSTGQHIRGLKHGRHRPDLIILDDIEDTDSVRTQEGRDRTFEWLTSEVIPSGDKGTRIIAIGNLLHEDSVLKRLERKIKAGMKNAAYREYAIVDENGEPTWPGKYMTLEDIEAEREKIMDPVAWAREFLLKIIAPEDQVIRPEWIKTYSELPPLNHGYHATGIDLAISLAASADYTAMVSARVCGEGESLRIYILPNPINKKLTALETLQCAKDISDALGRGKLFIEAVQYQASLVDHLRNANYPAFGVKVHGQDKRARLSAVSFLVQNGRVLFPETGAEILVNQIIGFGTEKHDDLVDAFSMLLAQVLEEDHAPKAMAIRTRVLPGELDHLNSRARAIEIEKRKRNARFFQI